ncbi:MAG TPA: pentapeptide repeat-containing protein, partial [Candidatus Nitrosotalea sp.]|nr:pentapeptide repeat-containing protein [Candidatus Nitrosotalea sp.]
MTKIVLLSALILVVSLFAMPTSNVMAQNALIPSAVKNSAKSWINGQISDNDFLAALQQLINNGMLVLTTQNHPSTPSNNVNCMSMARPGIDWSGCDLSGKKLSGVNLSGADLSDSILKGIDLSKSNLSGADMSGANLYGAN